MKTKTILKIDVDLSSLQDRKIFREFAEETSFVIEITGRTSSRDNPFIILLKSAVLMISTSGISITTFLPSDPNELCERLELSLQERQAGNNSDIINEEVFVTLDKLLEYKCISKKQHN